MRDVRIALFVFLFLKTLSSAQQTGLTLEQALELAKQRAPRILAAQDRIEEARGRLKGASVLFQSNPELEFAAGPRNGASGSTTDIELGAAQQFELGGRRGSRIAAAKAEVEQASAQSQNTLRILLGDVARAYIRAATAVERIRLGQAGNDISGTFLKSMERRLELGDIPVLDVNLARSAAARTRADLQSAEAELISAVGDLRIFLGLAATEPLQISGELPWKQEFSAESIIAEAFDRPDLRGIAAELNQAETEVRLGRGLAWPDLSVGVRHQREEGDKVTKGVLSLTLPLFNRGQELRAVGSARATRLRRELEASRRAIEVEVRTALDSYQRRRAAAEDLERDAIRKLNENEQLARRSYEEGQISLVELLLIRKDNLEMRNLYVDRQLEAAVAAIEVQERSGTLR